MKTNCIRKGITQSYVANITIPTISKGEKPTNKRYKALYKDKFGGNF